MPSFCIVKVLEDGTEEKIVGYPNFDSGKDAKHYAEQLQQMHPGVKFQPRPVKVENASHKQKGLVPIPFWKHNLKETRTRNPTVFIDPLYDPAQQVVRYFATPEAKAVGKSVAIELQTFLAKFFDYDDEQVMWTIGIDPTWFDKNYTFGIARTEEEILEVYNDGIDSCMTKSERYYVNYENPVRVYATDDFGVAWLKDKTTGRLKARAVVSPPRNIFGRIYGNDKVMRYFLHREGYAKGFGDDWIGLKFPTKWVEGRYIDGEEDPDDDDDCTEHGEGYQAPYIDGIQSVRIDDEDNPKFLILDFDGDHRAYCTHGTTAEESDDRYFCNECNKTTREPWCLHADDGEERCYDCAKKRYGLVASSRLPPDSYNYDRYYRKVEHTEDGYLVYTGNTGDYRRCTVTNQWFVVYELPTFFGERLTPAEAKEKYNEHWPLFENAFVQTSRKVADRGTVYQKVPAAA